MIFWTRFSCLLPSSPLPAPRFGQRWTSIRPKFEADLGHHHGNLKMWSNQGSLGLTLQYCNAGLKSGSWIVVFVKLNTECWDNCTGCVATKQAMSRTPLHYQAMYFCSKDNLSRPGLRSKLVWGTEADADGHASYASPSRSLSHP